MTIIVLLGLWRRSVLAVIDSQEDWVVVQRARPFPWLPDTLKSSKWKGSAIGPNPASCS